MTSSSLEEVKMRMRAQFFLVLLTLFCGKLLAEPSEDLFIYTPSQDAMQAFFGMHKYLQAWEENPSLVTSGKFKTIYEKYVGKGRIDSLVLEAFLIGTKEKNVQNEVLGYLEAAKDHSVFSEVLRQAYQAKNVGVLSDTNKLQRSSLNNEKFDEGINYFGVRETTFMDKQIGILMPDNPWSTLKLTNSDSPESDRDRVTFIVGGGTNSILLSIQKFDQVSNDSIIDRMKINVLKERYHKDPIMYDLPLEGVIARSGADRYLLLYQTGEDMFPGVDSGTFLAYLYNSNKKILYELNYYINISPGSILYPIKNRLYNLILFSCMFAYLD